MLFLGDLIFALIIAVLLTLVIAVLFGRRGPWASISIFFLVVFLAAWAAGKWIHPVGPAWYGVFWLPFLMFGLVVALLLAAAIPYETPLRERRGESGEGEGVRTERRVFNVFFWLLLLVLLVLIIASYF